MMKGKGKIKNKIVGNKVMSYKNAQSPNETGAISNLEIQSPILPGSGI